MNQATPVSTSPTLATMMDKRILREKATEEEKQGFAELQEHFADPSCHYRYAMFKDKLFTDFQLVCKEQSYSVHKLVLLSKSRYFQGLFNSEWKESGKATMEIPQQDISNEVFEAFLLFLYTNCIEYSVLKQHHLNLYDLADYFQVETLKRVTERGMKKWLTIEMAKLYLPRIRRCNMPDLLEIFTTLIATNHVRLCFDEFPFHQLGKTLLWTVLEKMTAKIKRSIPFNYPACHLIGTIQCLDPSKDELYPVFKEGKFSDINIDYGNTVYKLHKSVLVSEVRTSNDFLREQLANCRKVKSHQRKHLRSFSLFSTRTAFPKNT
jgi:hypothetical protein